MKIFLTAVAAIAGIVFLGWILTANDILMTRHLGVPAENARRAVFEHSQSYVQGKADYINHLRLDYENAEPGSAHRASLRTTILTEAETVDINDLPVNEQTFLRSLEVR